MGGEPNLNVEQDGVDRTATAFPEPRGRAFWLHAASAGVIAGQVFAVWFQFTMDVMPALGTVFFLGEPQLSFPWAVHLVNSALFGLLYAGLVDSQALRPHAARSTRATVLGAAYGVVLWLLLSVLFWPFWAVVFPGFASPSVDALVRPSLAYLLWGMLTGGLFAEFRRL